ncbi:MAG: hypothetical protein E4G90_11170 [Gemmatimonadales bacterium]|nr:MAG: hypothetical protein E4G90_11170 [Gemmatimonadales bacterium]
MTSGNWIFWREYPQVEPKISAAIQRARDLEPQGSVVLTTQGLGVLFDAVKNRGVQPEWLLMHGVTFAPIRKFGRDILDIPPDSPPGHAELWGATILTDPEIPKGDLIVVGHDGEVERFLVK